MAKHSLVRLKGSLVNTPHLIEPNSFGSIMEYVNKRIEGNADVVPKAIEQDDEDDLVQERISHGYNPDTKTGILYIDGPLTYKTTGWEALCGGTSYEMLKEQMEAYVSYGAKTVAMICSSGGGEAHGMMDSANYVRKLADENGINLVCYVDGMSASASYGWSVVADEIYMSEDSQVGSVGVLIQLINNSKNLEMNGFERLFIHAGEEKIPFDKEGNFAEHFLDRLQEQVDMLYEGFTTHVAEHRNMTVQAVKDTKANVFLSQEAIQLGLADGVMTAEEFYEYLADVAQKNLEVNVMGDQSKNRAFKFFNKEDKAEMSQLKELQALAETQEALLQDKEAALIASLEQVNTLQASVGELTSKLESLQAFAEEHKAAAELAKAEAQRVAEEAAQAKVDQRMASLKDVLAEDQVEATYAALSSLDDASFSVIVSQYAATKQARAEAFKAIGGEGVEQESLVAEHDSVDAIRQAGVAHARQRFTNK